MKSVLAALSLALVLSAGGPEAFAQDQAPLAISCGSENGAFTRCRAPDRFLVREVRITARRSDAKCRLGNEYGWDEGAVWVDDGCRGDFAVYGAAVDMTPETVSCGSSGYDKRFCPMTRPVYAARRVDTRSNAKCRHGESWWFDLRGLWVDEGCRGDFVINDPADLGAFTGKALARPLDVSADAGATAEALANAAGLAQGLSPNDAAIAACARRAAEEAWAAGAFSAQFEGPPEVNVAAGAHRVVGVLRIHGPSGYARQDLRCLAENGIVTRYQAVDRDGA